MILRSAAVGAVVIGDIAAEAVGDAVCEGECACANHIRDRARGDAAIGEICDGLAEAAEAEDGTGAGDGERTGGEEGVIRGNLQFTPGDDGAA